MGEQALKVVKQGIEMALSAGVFKSTQDVALLHNSLLELQKFVESSNATNNAIKEDSKVMQEKATIDSVKKTK
jgi:cation transport ATPase